MKLNSLSIKTLNWISLLIAFISAITLAGCSSFNFLERKLVSQSDLIDPKFTDSEPVLITADLQIHFVYNPINTRSNFFNRFSESIRPIASDLFSPDHFDFTIDKFQRVHPKGKVIILGDVLDVSCDWEANKFFSIMKNKPNWVMAPGNHDFIFLGTHEKNERSKHWLKGCAENKGHDGRFNKAEYIFTYLEALANQAELSDADSSYSAFSNCFSKIRKDRRAVHDCLNNMKIQKLEDPSGIDRNCPAVRALGDQWVNCKVASEIPEKLKDIPNQGWWKNKDPNGYLQDVFWYINPAQDTKSASKEVYYSYSYIVQRVRLPDGRYAVLLDTNNPAKIRSVLHYSIGYNPANSANMLYSQMNAASLMMGGNKIFIGSKTQPKNITKSNAEHVLMSHHPIADYRLEAKKGLCMLINVGNSSYIYTAHTHSPSHRYYKNLHTNIHGCENVTEYNIGSMIDAPLEYMLLANIEGESISSTISLNNEYSASCETVESKWRRKENSSDYYTSYSDLGWLANADRVHDNLSISMLNYFIEMLEVTEGFNTISADWPKGFSSDEQVKSELFSIKEKIQSGTSAYLMGPQLEDMGRFFSSRKVENMDNLNRYKFCHLYWASLAKKKLK